jgi:hypothetical protein
MPVSRWRAAVAPLLVAAVASPLACGPSAPGAVSVTIPAGGACEELRTGDFSRLVLEHPSPGGELVKFLLAHEIPLPGSEPALEKELIDACAELGLAAGLLPADVLGAPDSGRGAEKVCSVAATKVLAMFRKAKDQKVPLDVHIDASPCFVDAVAARQCFAECGVTAKGDMRAECVGGELVGTCQGRCAGKCTFPAGPGGGACDAVCTGRCDHDFRGRCDGACLGTCDGQPNPGGRPCGGICDGVCQDRAVGFCGGRCDGQCSGLWTRSVPSGSCSGACLGGCAGEVASPLCTGEYTPSGAEPLCAAACGAAEVVGARCDPPVVHVVIRGGNPSPELVKLLYGVQSAVPRILRQRAAAKRVTRALQVATAASIGWSTSFSGAGQRPLTCVRAAVDAMKDALAAVDLCSRGADAVADAIKTDPVPGRD